MRPTCDKNGFALSPGQIPDKYPSTQSHRVAVIEIGGRGIRGLVADISMAAGLKTVWTDKTTEEEIDLADLDEFKIAKAAILVNEFRRTAEAYHPMQIVIFGTEMVRKLEGGPLWKSLHAEVSDLRVLSHSEEAELSFWAGVMAIQDRSHRDATSLVIDQGSDSMEIILGTMGLQGPSVKFFKTYELGTRTLAKLLLKAGDLKRFRQDLNVRFPDFLPLTSDQTEPPIVLGSAATKIAWLDFQQTSLGAYDPLRRYDPRRVQGRVIPVNLIGRFISAAEADPAVMRNVICPEDRSGIEFEMIISGLIALDVFLSGGSKTEFVVCGDGTRYGLAWKIALTSLRAAIHA